MAESSVAVRRRLRPAERRAEIVQVATSLIAERGYNRLTLSELAARAGITRAGLSHHFPTREDVFVAVLESRDEADISHLLTEFDVAEPDREVRTAEEFVEVLNALVRRNAVQPEIVRLYTVLGAEALAEDHPAHDYFQRRLDESHAGMAKLASRWHPRPDELSIEVHAYLDGIQLAWLRQPSRDLFALWRPFAEALLSAHAGHASPLDRAAST